MNKQLSNQPYKGTKDFLPDEYLVQDYIFSVWKEVCLKFAYKEYQTPLLEFADLYRAKSGEDVGGKELFTLRDLADRELAIRPEMTPSVTRLVTRIFNEVPKPIRLFNISNFCRNERPQKGRNREFWQLNADIFGDDSINADVEILALSVEIMRAFNAPANSYKLYFNNRKLLDSFLDDELNLRDSTQNKQELVRLMDKFEKFSSEEDFVKALVDKGFNEENNTKVLMFLRSTGLTLLENFPNLESTDGVKEIIYVREILASLGYEDVIEFKPNIIRGFDYYDGTIFEIFDMNPENNRALFGGGRYNGLAGIFGMNDIPAVGFAPGNETLTIFLKNWNLIPDIKTYKEFVYFPVLEGIQYVEALQVSNLLRQKGYRVQLDTKESKLTSALRNANKLDVNYVAIYGTLEKDNKTITLKNLGNGKESKINLD